MSEIIEKKEKRLLTSGNSFQFVSRDNNFWNSLSDEIMYEELYDVTLEDAANGDTEKIDSFFMSLKEIPAYRYVIRGLCSELSKNYEETEIIKLFAEIEKEDLSETSDALLTDLAVALQQRYEENVGKHAPDVDVIKNGIVHFDREFLMNFLIWTIVEENNLLDALMTEVLGGQGLDYYDRDQFLTFLTFAYDYNGVFSRYQIFERLKEIYESIEIKTKAKKTVEGTIYIQKEAEEILGAMDLDIDSKVTPELEKLLKWHKSLRKPEIRTIGKEYGKLLDEVMGLYDIDVLNFLWNCEELKFENRNDYKEYAKKHQRIELTVSYDGIVDPSCPEKADGTDAVLFKEGTVFSGYNFVYTLDYDAHLPRRARLEEILIPVAAIGTVPAPGKLNNLPASVELKICDKNGVVDEKLMEEYQVRVYTFPVGKKEQKGKKGWNYYSNPAYNRNVDGGKCCVLIDTKPGLKIVAGETCFVYEAEGNKYISVAKNDAVIDCRKVLYPYYENADVINCFEKEQNPNNMGPDDIKRLKKLDGNLLMEKSNENYDVLEIDKAAGYVVGYENIRSIENKSPVIHAKNEIMEEAFHTDTDTMKMMAKNQAPLLLDIEYPANREVVLKKGTTFKARSYFKNEEMNPLKANEQNVFTLANDVVLPAVNQRTIAVQVLSTDKEKRPGVKKEMLNANSPVRVEYTKPVDENAPKSLSVACGNKQKPRLYGDKTAGFLYVTCECGTVIDESVHFIAEMGGQEYCFVPVEKKIEVSKEFVEYKGVHVYVDEENMYPLSTVKNDEFVLARACTYFDLINPPEGTSFGAITCAERYVWDPKNKEKTTDKKAFFDYLFSLKDYGYFKDYAPKLDMENLSVPWFQNMFLQDWTEEELCKLPMNQARSVLMTLVFMKAVKNKTKQMSALMADEEWLKELNNYTEFSYKINEAMNECRMNDFVLEANKIMNKCRLEDYYAGNPCDCLLSYLFASDSPVDALRILFKLSKGRKR